MSLIMKSRLFNTNAIALWPSDAIWWQITWSYSSIVMIVSWKQNSFNLNTNANIFYQENALKNPLQKRHPFCAGLNVLSRSCF